MTDPTIDYKTVAQTHARINQLEALLGLTLSAEEPVIDKAWLRIEELEKMLEEKPGATTPPAPKPSQSKAVPSAGEADPIKPAELHGVMRAAAAQREGRTAKPTPKASTAPLTGVMRAAKAQDELNRQRQNKS